MTPPVPPLAPQQVHRGRTRPQDDLLPRRIGKWDLAAFVRLHERCSAATLRARYFVGLRPQEMAARPGLLEPTDGIALGFFAGYELVAVGQLATRHGGVPEIALLVEDSWQRRGLGRRMLLALFLLAAERGVHEVTLDISGENRAMWRLLAGLTGVGQVHYEGGFAEVRVRVAQPAVA